jgi:signal transduction histidine kinase
MKTIARLSGRWLLIGSLFASLSWHSSGRSADTISPPFPPWSASAGQSNAQFSISAASAGDVNGDGFGDIIVGAPLYTHTFYEEGAAFVYYGSASGLPLNPSWAVYGEQRAADFGMSVAAGGDVNRDGFDDVIIGARSYTFRSGEYDVGAVFIYTGSPNGLSATPAWMIEGTQTNSHFGYAVSGAGDVNGDGFPDVIVSALRHWEHGKPVGKIFAFHGSTNGFGATADWSFTGDQADAQFAYRVGALGDVNKDGFDDVIFSARDYDTVKEDAGKVFVFYGSRRGLGPKPDWTFEGKQLRGYLGSSCGGAGDVNGDGFADVIVGAPSENHGEQREGAAYVFYGSPRGLTELNWFVECNQSGSSLGQGASGAGDVNGDGFADIIIGAPSHRGRTRGGEGRAFVFHGTPAGLQTEPAWIMYEERPRLLFGRTAASAGDINCDGFSDVLVGTIMDRGVAEGGQVSVYAGSRNGVLPNLLGQMPHRIAARRFIPPAPPLWSYGWFWGAAGLVLVGMSAAAWHIVTTTRLRRQLRRAEQQRMIEQERLRIAQDLHDHLGSNLATITLLSEVARRDLDVPGRAQAHLTNITGTARDLTRALEEIVWAVNPRKNRLDQLVSYFSAYAEEFLKPTDLRCRLDFPDELPELVVPSEIRHELFLVFKEALTNVVKHAAAAEVRIRLSVEEHALSLTIDDNGRGFDSALVRPGRDGLTNMRSRVEKLGGRCDIASQPGGGTRVQVEVSLHDAVSSG